MKNLGLSVKLIKITKMTLFNTRNKVRVNGELSESFETKNINLENIFEDSKSI